MSIREFCVRNVVCTTRTATITQVAALMREHHVGDVVVVDDDGKRKVPVGILTDRDIVVAVVAADVDPARSCSRRPAAAAARHRARRQVLRRYGAPHVRTGRAPPAGGRGGWIACRHHLGRRHPAPIGGAARGAGRVAEARAAHRNAAAPQASRRAARGSGHDEHRGAGEPCRRAGRAAPRWPPPAGTARRSSAPGLRAASAMNSSPSRRVRLATERTRRSSHSSA